MTQITISKWEYKSYIFILILGIFAISILVWDSDRLCTTIKLQKEIIEEQSIIINLYKEQNKKLIHSLEECIGTVNLSSIWARGGENEIKTNFNESKSKMVQETPKKSRKEINN